MNLQKTALELKNQNDFLNSISKEEITFLIKASIFELENLQILSEEELTQLNKVILTNEPFNNLYFKYNKERLNTRGVIFLEEENDLEFIVSVLLYFKFRTPLMVYLSSDIQNQFYNVFIKVLNDNKASNNFIVKIDA